MSYKYLFAIVCILCAFFPCVLAAPSLSWDNDSGYCITAMDSNSAGSLLMVGLGNGSIFGYDTVTDMGNATLSWSYPTNGSIKKIVSDSNGNSVWINKRNETGYLSSTGIQSGFITDTGRNITDIKMAPDGTFAISELFPPRLTVYHSDGTIHAQNTSFGVANWTGVGYDPNGEWLVSSNKSESKLYFWNITGWIGWEQFNPLHTAVKNSSQIALDSFSYRENVSFSAGDSANSNRIWMYNVTNVTTPVKISDGYYFYNGTTTGRYYYFTLPGNLSNNQTTLLNMSYSDLTQSVYVLRPGHTNYTMYYGNLTYGFGFLNQTWTNNNIETHTNLTYGTTSWTAPAGVYSVNLTMYGGGGGGTYSIVDYTYGNGGSAAIMTPYVDVPVTPGNTYTVSIGAGGSTSGGNGGTSTFNNDGLPATANGGTGGNVAGGLGANGNSSIAGYPTGSTGASGSIVVYGPPYTCGPQAGRSGGIGYGAGGGGGGYRSAYHAACEYSGAGGAGAPGVIQLNYYTNNVPVYYYGEIAASHEAEPTQVIQTSNSLNQTSTKDYVGSILGLAVPNNGQLVSVMTDTITYQQYLSATGFGITYNATLSSGSPALFAGTPHDIKASNSGSATVEGRGAYGNVYDAGAVAKASSLTGGTILSVDSAMSSGLMAAFGGDEGKLYMVSREGSTSWYSYFTGTAGYQINSIAMSWNGQYVAVGRENGLLEFYNTSVASVITPTPTSGTGSASDVSLRVYKDSSPYALQNVTIFSSATAPYNWVPLGTSHTDGNGRMTYTCAVGTYYKFVVNNAQGTTSGEGEAIWQANTQSTIVQIRILSASLPFEWNAVYNTAEHNVSVTYTDSVPADVTISIKDTKTNLIVLTRSYNATQGFTLDYHDQNENGTYQVVMRLNRMGMTTQDTRTVMSIGANAIPISLDPVIKYSLGGFILMLIAGMFGYVNARRGAFVVVIIAVVFMIFDFLPQSIITILTIAAMFAVASLFGSRTQ